MVLGIGPELLLRNARRSPLLPRLPDMLVAEVRQIAERRIKIELVHPVRMILGIDEREPASAAEPFQDHLPGQPVPLVPIVAERRERLLRIGRGILVHQVQQAEGPPQFQQGVVHLRERADERGPGDPAPVRLRRHDEHGPAAADHGILDGKSPVGIGLLPGLGGNGAADQQQRKKEAERFHGELVFHKDTPPPFPVRLIPAVAGLKKS